MQVREGIKETVKFSIKNYNEKIWGEHAKKLTKQGNLLALAKLQNSDLTFKSYIFNTKKGVLKFVLNATLDTLPTNANLLQWGKVISDKCPLCKISRQTTSHILNGCKVSLNQKRFTWRHDGIVSYVSSCIDRTRYECVTDLPGESLPGGGTISPNVTVTPLRPDIVITDKKEKKIYLFELTVPFELNIQKRHQEKENKYSHFLTEITQLKPSLVCWEIGSRGFIDQENKARLKLLHNFCKKGLKFKTFMENISSLAVNASYFLFINRKSPEWETPPLLNPSFK